MGSEVIGSLWRGFFLKFFWGTDLKHFDWIFMIVILFDWFFLSS